MSLGVTTGWPAVMSCHRSAWLRTMTTRFPVRTPERIHQSRSSPTPISGSRTELKKERKWPSIRVRRGTRRLPDLDGICYPSMTLLAMLYLFSGNAPSFAPSSFRFLTDLQFAESPGLQFFQQSRWRQKTGWLSYSPGAAAEALAGCPDRSPVRQRTSGEPYRAAPVFALARGGKDVAAAAEYPPVLLVARRLLSQLPEIHLLISYAAYGGKWLWTGGES